MIVKNSPMRQFLKITYDLILLILISLFCSQSIWAEHNLADQVEVYTRPYEFDYFYWTIQSLWSKETQSAIGVANFIPANEKHRLVTGFMSLVHELDDVESVIEQTYSDPKIIDPQIAAKPLIDHKVKLDALYDQQALLVESILQNEISDVLNQLGISFQGVTFPPVLYRLTTLPDQLVVSPRNIIREDAGISLNPGLSAQQIRDLENIIETNLHVSALVVPLGGVGVYPTMVYRTSDLVSLLEVIAHEWTHNFLTLHPLGINYDSTPQLRSMNETVAEISGKEISHMVLLKYFPEYLPDQSSQSDDIYQVMYTLSQQNDSNFDYQKEMHLTRVRVDELLAQGKINEAETYMEQRRIIFWQNGYQIRRINQAYFAFYGAYESNELGPAGSDPVGPAVRQLRAQSKDLKDFLNRIAGMSSFTDLQNAVKTK